MGESVEEELVAASFANAALFCAVSSEEARAASDRGWNLEVERLFVV